MAFILFALSAIGLAFLIICIFKLASPFIGWNCKYDASTMQKTTNIPKSGRYSINIRRDMRRLSGFVGMSNMFPQANFSVKRIDGNEMIQYFPRRSLLTSRTGRRMTVLVGHFDVSVPGKYLITSLPESKFLPNDEIVIRKYMPFLKFFLLIWGTIIASFIFLFPLIIGILILTGNWELSGFVPSTLIPYIN